MSSISCPLGLTQLVLLTGTRQAWPSGTQFSPRDRSFTQTQFRGPALSLLCLCLKNQVSPKIPAPSPRGAAGLQPTPAGDAEESQQQLQCQKNTQNWDWNMHPLLCFSAGSAGGDANTARSVWARFELTQR